MFGTANREWLDRSSVKTRARAILDPIPLQCRRLQKIARKVHCSLRRGTGGRKRGRKDKGKDKRQRLVLEAAINRGSKQGEIRRDSPGRFCSSLVCVRTNLGARYKFAIRRCTNRNHSTRNEVQSRKAEHAGSRATLRCIIVATNYPCFCTRTIYTLHAYRYTGCPAIGAREKKKQIKRATSYNF